MLVEQLVPRLGLPVAIAVVTGLVTGFGDHADVDLYSTLAQVLPVLALAGFVELMPLMQRILEDVDISGSPDWEREFSHAFVQIWVYVFVGYLVLGEATALWAVAQNRSTTFLLLTACFSGLIMVWYLTAMHLERYDAFIDKRASRAEERLEEVKQGMKDASA